MVRISRAISPTASQITTTAMNTRDVLAECAHEVGDDREMRRDIAAAGEEPHIRAPKPRDAAVTLHALRVGDEHHLQHAWPTDALWRPSRRVTGHERGGRGSGGQRNDARRSARIIRTVAS